jgi:hypothetical protein
MDFIGELHAEWDLKEDVTVSAHKVWTSAKKLGDAREFCSVFGEALRVDTAALAPHLALLARALNDDLVTRGVPFADQAFPRGPAGGVRDKSTEANVCWRGGGFMDNAMTRGFFVPRKKYRVAQFLATSFARRVSKHFLTRCELNDVVNARVQWRVQLDPDRGCRHVNLIRHTHVEGEFEFLFSAFSAFEVLEAKWSESPQDPDTPHVITVRAAVDNKDPEFPENLPLAPWC